MGSLFYSLSRTNLKVWYVDKDGDLWKVENEEWVNKGPYPHLPKGESKPIDPRGVV